MVLLHGARDARVELFVGEVLQEDEASAFAFTPHQDRALAVQLALVVWPLGRPQPLPTLKQAFARWEMVRPAGKQCAAARRLLDPTSL
jgi:hypothetical protein